MTLGLLLVSHSPLDSAFIPYPRSASRKTSPTLNMDSDDTELPYFFLSWAGGDAVSARVEGDIGVGGFCGKWGDLREKAGLE